MQLPIDIVPNTSPPIFRWGQVVDTIGGKQVVYHQEALSPTVEVALTRLITVAKQLAMDNATLQGQVAALTPTPTKPQPQPTKPKVTK